MIVKAEKLKAQPKELIRMPKSVNLNG